MIDLRLQVIAGSKYVRARYGGLAGVSSSLRERYNAGEFIGPESVEADDDDTVDRPLSVDCD